MGVNANNKVSDAEIYKILNKYKVVGIPIEELQTYTGEKSVIILHYTYQVMLQH